MRSLSALRELSQRTAKLVERRQEAPYVGVISPGGEGGGAIVPITVRVISVSADRWSCKNHDADGNPTGDPFDVFPWVVDNNGYVAAPGYDLTSTGVPRVIPRYQAGNYIRIWPLDLPWRRAAPGGPTVARKWAVETFHLIGCNA